LPASRPIAFLSLGEEKVTSSNAKAEQSAIVHILIKEQSWMCGIRKASLADNPVTHPQPLLPGVSSPLLAL